MQHFTLWLVLCAHGRILALHFSIPRHSFGLLANEERLLGAAVPDG